MNVAEYLIARLQEAGLEHVFAVPGDYASAFLEALDATPGIERIANVNELGSGYAADGYARFKGIGAACVQYGVGGFSILDATAGSFVERVPVVVISASPSATNQELERTKRILFHHSTGNLRADQIVFAEVTVASVVVRDPQSAPAQIDAAVVAMLTHKRPIYIEVLSDVWTLDCTSPDGTLAPVTTSSDPGRLAPRLRTRGPASSRHGCPSSGPGSRSSASVCRPRSSRSSTPAACTSPPRAWARPCSTRRSPSSSAPMPGPLPR